MAAQKHLDVREQIRVESECLEVHISARLLPHAFWELLSHSCPLDPPLPSDF